MQKRDILKTDTKSLHNSVWARSSKTSNKLLQRQALLQQFVPGYTRPQAVAIFQPDRIYILSGKFYPGYLPDIDDARTVDPHESIRKPLFEILHRLFFEVFIGAGPQGYVIPGREDTVKIVCRDEVNSLPVLDCDPLQSFFFPLRQCFFLFLDLDFLFGRFGLADIFVPQGQYPPAQ